MFTEARIDEVFKDYIAEGKTPSIAIVTQIASTMLEFKDCDPRKIHAYIWSRISNSK